VGCRTFDAAGRPRNVSLVMADEVVACFCIDSNGPLDEHERAGPAIPEELDFDGHVKYDTN
jgi:hypothetical protein